MHKKIPCKLVANNFRNSSFFSPSKLLTIFSNYVKEMCGCFTYILSKSDNDKLRKTHVTVILKQILCY